MSDTNEKKREQRKGTLWGLAAFYAALLLFSLCLGRYPITIAETVRILASQFLSLEKTWNPTMEMVIISVRLPRLLAATLVGSSLALAGVCFQGMFKNPLVSPDILGVSSGAGFGAGLGILLGLGAIGIQSSALLFGTLAVGIAYFLRSIYKTNNALILVLSGIIVSGFFASVLSFLKYVADPYETLPAIIFWLMGSLAAVDFQDLLTVAAPILIGTVLLLSLKWKFNVLSLGNAEASALGIDVKRMQAIIILSATVITASAVSISGTIGWIGLVVPHIARLIVGTNHSRLIPASALLGAIALIIVDDFSRTLTGEEIPLGIITGLVGTPVFIYLMFRKRMNIS